MADEERINPEEDPEAALEALAEGSAPESPARRRRLARAALYGFRDARRSGRIGMAVAAAALAVAMRWASWRSRATAGARRPCAAAAPAR